MDEGTGSLLMNPLPELAALRTKQLFSGTVLSLQSAARTQVRLACCSTLAAPFVEVCIKLVDGCLFGIDALTVHLRQLLSRSSCGKCGQALMSLCCSAANACNRKMAWQKLLQCHSQ